jgi:hypothetical protein
MSSIIRADNSAGTEITSRSAQITQAPLIARAGGPAQLGPLTTIFTPPASCTNSWTFEPSSYNGFSPGLLVQNALATSIDPSCFPSSWFRYGRSSYEAYYRPGQCPAGYSTALARFSSYTQATCCLSLVSNYESCKSLLTDSFQWIQFECRRWIDGVPQQMV